MKKTVIVCDACGKPTDGPAWSVDLKSIRDHLETCVPQKDACNIGCAFSIASDHYHMETAIPVQRASAVVRSPDHKIVIEMDLAASDAPF